MKNKKLLLPDKKINAIIKCLEHIEENSSTSSDGKPTISVDIIYDFVKEILREYISFGDNIPEGTKRRIVFSAQMRWLKYKKVGKSSQKLQLFLRAVEVEVAKIKRQQSKYTVLMFLNVDLQSIADFGKVNILGDSITFISWQDVSNLHVSNLWQEVKIQDRDNPILWDIPDLNQPTPDFGKFAPLLFEVNTFGPEAAIEIASDRIDLLRVILNVPSVLGGYTYFRSKPKALSKVLPSPIYVIIDEERKKTSIYYTVEKYDYTQERIPIARIPSIQFLLSKCTTVPFINSSWGYILNIFRLYQKSLDTLTVETAYLTMWQVLENCIGFGEELTRNRDIQSRISVFVKLDPISIEIIDILIDRRNRLVHSGKFLDDGDHLLFILKLITDSVVRSMISLADKYPTLAELKEYVAFSSLGSDDLERKKSVIEKITEMRKKG